MLGFLDGIRGISFWQVIIKLAVATVLGGIIGFERSYKNRPAGFRTHILVALGATVASMTGMYISNLVQADISRIGAAVVAGLGFLGAGTIIVTKSFTIKGLTTAAGLWTSGIIGLAVGAGFYEGAVITAALVLFAETALGGMVNRIRRDPEFCIQVTFKDKTALDQVMRCCKNHRLVIINLRVVSSSADEDGATLYRAQVMLSPRIKAEKERLYRDISQIKGLIEFSEVEIKELP